MDKKILSDSLNRRVFLTNILPMGPIFCFGHNNLLGTSRAHKTQKVSTTKHKFFKKSGMSFEEVFQLFKNTLSMEVVKKTDKVLGIKITECL